MEAASPGQRGSVPVVDRRAAMRAMLAGSVAAGVFVAPRVQGLSVVPGYAAAATGTDASDSVDVDTVTQRANPAAFCLQRCCITCWNTTGLVTNCATTTCTCGTNKSCGNSTNDALTGTLTVNKNAGPPITLNYNLWGPTEGCAPPNPALNMVLAGIDSPFQSCDVEVTGVCPPGTFSGGISNTHTSNTNFGPLTPACNGSLIDPGGCGAMMNQPCAPTSFCAAPATLTITLTCTFT